MSVIETARLRLRKMGGEDACFILEVLTDPDFIANVGDRDVHDLPAARRYIADGPGGSYVKYGFGLYLVERLADGAPLGICGLLRRDSHPDVEIGFAFVPRARGQGYALEAARATLAFAQHTFGLTRIVALTAPDNRPSIRILESIGLRFERLVRFTPEAGERRLFVFEQGA
ncbi:MAG TPA: GNAT family N-acetyltransferase [Steroidobacteraceae bacterium]|jgi:RimJ/RimL family protein N-acetyltransferase|nr:GNAT family N-acetyltransferase [Steroidobacteraceae bacterium]